MSWLILYGIDHSILHFAVLRQRENVPVFFKCQRCGDSAACLRRGRVRTQEQFTVEVRGHSRLARCLWSWFGREVWNSSVHHHTTVSSYFQSWHVFVPPVSNTTITPSLRDNSIRQTSTHYLHTSQCSSSRFRRVYGNPKTTNHLIKSNRIVSCRWTTCTVGAFWWLV